MTIDLDDLFHDCYFGDFSVSESIGNDSTTAEAPESQTPTPSTTSLLPSAQRNSFTPSSTTANVPPPVPSATYTPALTPATIMPQQQQQQQLTENLLKRKIPVVEPTPVSVLSSTPSYAHNTISTNNSTMYTYPPGFSTGTANSRQLTDQQKVERRNRNREHAKRSRLRKKFLLESLQEQIHGLQSEIEDLKSVIIKELPDRADAILEKINGKQGQFTPLPMPSGFGPVKTLMEPDFRLMSALSGSQQNFAISDPSLPDNPIVYVSQGFLDLTGYTLDQVLGRNCRFLQGPGTDQSAVDVIRKGVRQGVDTSVCLLNYKADGTPFWNQFFVAALRDAENNVVNFVGVQCEVSKAVVESQMTKSKNGQKES